MEWKCILRSFISLASEVCRFAWSLFAIGVDMMGPVERFLGSKKKKKKEKKKGGGERRLLPTLC